MPQVKVVCRFTTADDVHSFEVSRTIQMPSAPTRDVGILFPGDSTPFVPTEITWMVEEEMYFVTTEELAGYESVNKLREEMKDMLSAGWQLESRSM